MRPLRILKIAWVWFWSICAGLVALIAVLLYGMYYLEDPSRGEFVRNLVFEERAYEVTVDLVVEGEPLTITRWINCVPYLSGVELKIRRSWKPSLESFGKRLKSGHAVIVVAPSLCKAAELSFGEIYRPIPLNDDYIPLIRWVDDPDRPSVIEDYIGRGYFQLPNARIRYRDMSVRAVPYRSSEMDFEGLDGAGRPFRKRDSGAAYGYVAWPITEKEWSADQVIAEEVQSIETISELPLELTRRFNGKFPPNIHYGTVNGGYGLVPGPRATGTGNYRRIERDLNQIVPLSFNDDAFELDERKRGYLILYPMASNPPAGNDPLVMRLRINEQTMSVEFAGFTGATTIYVPETKTIYQLKALWKGVPNIAEN